MEFGYGMYDDFRADSIEQEERECQDQKGPGAPLNNKNALKDKKSDKEISEAKAKVNSLEKYSELTGENDIKNVLPLDKNKSFLRKVMYEQGLLSASSEAKSKPKTKKIEIDKLTTIQNNLQRDVLITKIEEIGKSGKCKPIDVLKIGDINCIIDGNHRATASKMLGNKNIKANVYDLPDEYL